MQIKQLARLADERWASKPSFLDKPQAKPPTHALNGDSGNAKSQNPETTTQNASPQSKSATESQPPKAQNPWAKADNRNPGDSWQPAGWSPNSKRWIIHGTEQWGAGYRKVDLPKHHWNNRALQLRRYASGVPGIHTKIIERTPTTKFRFEIPLVASYTEFGRAWSAAPCLQSGMLWLWTMEGMAIIPSVNRSMQTDLSIVKRALV